MTGKIAVGGITRVDGLVMIRILAADTGHRLAGRALSSLGLNGINLNCVTSFLDNQGRNNLSFAIHADDLDQTLGILQSLADELQATNVTYERGCSAISIYGPHFSERPAIAGTVFEATAEAGVETLMISTSFSTVSFLTREDQAGLAIERLREDFLVP